MGQHIKTPSGTIERGHAKQRHFVRAAEKLSGVDVVVSHSRGKVRLSVGDGAQMTRLASLAREYGCELSVRAVNGDGIYETGHLALGAKF